MRLGGGLRLGCDSDGQAAIRWHLWWSPPRTGGGDGPRRAIVLGPGLTSDGRLAARAQVGPGDVVVHTRTAEPCEAREIDGVILASKARSGSPRGPRASQRKALIFGLSEGTDDIVKRTQNR